MSCGSSPDDPQFGVGGTFADGVGTGWCSDSAEQLTLAAAAALTLVATIVVCYTDTDRALLGIAAGASVALVGLSGQRLAYSAPVLGSHPRASIWQSRQIGVPVTTSLLTILYSLSLQLGSTHTGCAARIGGCIRVKAVDFAGWAYTAFAWSLAVAHLSDANSEAYVTFDWIGVAVGVAWAAMVVYECRAKSI